MIIPRAFRNEVLRTGLAIFLVLLVVFLFVGMTGLLARAVRGDIADQVVLALLGLQTVRRIDILLPLAFYLGVLLTAARWYRDSEMTVLAACGIGIYEILRPLMQLAAVLAVVVGGFAFYVTPLASHQIDIVKESAGQRPDPSQISAGAFHESAGRNRVIYAEQVGPQPDMLRDVFAAIRDDDRQTVLLARTGRSYLDTRQGVRFLSFTDGRAYEGEPGSGDFQVLEFARYDVRLEEKTFMPPPTANADLPTLELLRRGGPEHQAEWHWRLSRPLSVLVLAAFALLLAHTDVRRGRVANLFAAILVYFTYTNLLGVGEALIRKGQVPFWLGLWWVHAGFALIAIWLLSRRARNLPLLALPRFGAR